ncbi:MAG: hypothetical protein AB1393_01795 [Candidatus Edwardsbacteria bacterium]
MITNYEQIKRFENDFIKRDKVDVRKNFSIVSAMYEEAVKLGVFPIKNSLEGLEIDLKIAKVVNSVSKAPCR